MQGDPQSYVLSKRFPILFLGTAVALMLLYYSLPAYLIENVLVRFFAVVPGGFVLDWLTPDVVVTTDQTRILSSVAKLNVLKGCEGTEALLLLYAAILAMLKPLRLTFWGVLMGTLLVFMLNQLRIIALFFIVAYDKRWFELVHGFLAPLVILAVISLFFLGWLNWANQERAP